MKDIDGMKWITATLVALLATSASLAAPTTLPAVERDITYGKAGGKELKLNLARPTTRPNAKLPCILLVHGGGWQHGDKSMLDGLIQWFAAQGYVAATIGYRLAPEFIFPAQINDAKCAVRFMRAHANDYGIDPDRIGAVGTSAGAHLVMMLAVTRKSDDLEGDGGWPDVSSEVAAVVSWAGPTDLGADDIPAISKPIVKTFLGKSAEEAPDLAKKASPVSYVRKDQPPILQLLGTTDPLIPVTQATNMAKRMTIIGAPGRVELLLNVGHGFADKDYHHALVATMEFFNEHLREVNKPK